MITRFDAAAVNWDKGDGLVPAVVQDARNLRVLMVGYVNSEALAQSLATGLVTFYSRSKKRLWQKGESSGHVLTLVEARLDCDGDTFLFLATPQGPTCHLGTTTCFGEDATPSVATLADLAATIQQRRLEPSEKSYTAKLLASGVNRIAQKVGEEGVETALAAATQSGNLAAESADLLYHLLVLLEATGTDWMEVMAILQARSRSKK